MTQTELARRTRLSQSFIAKVEAGDKRLSASSRKKIARALKLPESKLLY
jgi:predicted transcriptional regulator